MTTTKPRLRRGFVLEAGKHSRLPFGWNLWIVEDGEDLEITEEGEAEGESAMFDRKLVIAALEKVLAKRNYECIPIDPESVEGDFGPGSWPEVPTLRRSDDGLIEYTHGCGEDRLFSRAAARLLLAALKGEA